MCLCKISTSLQARHAVQEMLHKSRELTQKLKQDESDSDLEDTVPSDSEVTEPTESGRIRVEALKNPWMNSVAPKASKPSESNDHNVNTQAKHSTSVSRLVNPEIVTGNVTIPLATNEKEGNVEGGAEGDKEEPTDASPEKSSGECKKAKKSRKLDIEDIDIDRLFENKFEQTSAKTMKMSPKKNKKTKSPQNVDDKKRSRKCKPLGQAKEEPELSESSDSDSDTEEPPKDVPELRVIKSTPLTTSLTRKRTLEDMDGDWSEEEEETLKPKRKQSDLVAGLYVFSQLTDSYRLNRKLRTDTNRNIS